ncbi:MAG: hypothetical protein ACNA8H_14060, partial [Anaerolineales bacterium]
AHLSHLLPRAVEQIQALITEYQTSTYSQKGANIEIARHAGIDIRNKSYLAVIQRLVDHLKELNPFQKDEYLSGERRYQNI